MTYAKDAQYEGNSGNPNFSSNPNGVVSIAGQLKELLFCDLDDNLEPFNCRVDDGNDHTDDIGTFEGQPPVILIHGTHDKLTPYANAKLIYERAKLVGLPSAMIRMEGKGHVAWNDVLTTYFDDMTTNLYDLVTKGAQVPEGCS